MKINNNKFILLLILVLAVFLRFYNLMHDAPYFFNPDERNMANGIMQLRLPGNLPDIFRCLISEFINPAKPPTPYNQKSPTCNLNPYFFAYGQFPLYLSFVSDQLTKPIINKVDSLTNSSFVASAPQDKQLTTNFPSAIFWLRFYSALASTLTVFIVYAISSKLFTLHFALLTSLMTAFTPGLIQSAHFGTTESLLTFFFMASVYLSIKYLRNLGHFKFIILTSLVIGLAIGSKLTGLFFFIPPIVTFMVRLMKVKLNKSSRKKYFVSLLSNSIGILLFIILTGIFSIISSPYNLVAPADFKSAVFGYEADVATGKYEAFYTRQFVNSIPILFQAEKVFPYALSWPIFVIGTVGLTLVTLYSFLYPLQMIFNQIQNVNFKIQSYKVKIRLGKYMRKFPILHFNLSFYILLFSFYIYFIPNSFLYAKWSRFMTPLLPFFSIFSALAMVKIFSLFNIDRPKFHPDSIGIKFQINIKKIKVINLLGYWVIGLLVIISLLPGAAFMSIYIHPDSRLQASYWIYQNIPKNAYILSETANVVDIPLGLPNDINEHIYNYTVVSFDFYHMDENPPYFDQLTTHLEKADYIFIPSRRIFANYTQHADKFPLTTKYYQLLFSGALGFEKIAEISSFPQLPISQIGPIRLIAEDEQAEETFTVFDHPVIRIYKKTRPFTLEYYRSLFGNEKSII